ncbi:hypothetical protein Tco_0065495 [Tanacetum coccineum]
MLIKNRKYLKKPQSGGIYSSLGDKLVSLNVKETELHCNVFQPKAEVMGVIASLCSNMWMRTQLKIMGLQLKTKYRCITTSSAIATSMHPVQHSRQSTSDTSVSFPKGTG